MNTESFCDDNPKTEIMFVHDKGESDRTVKSLTIRITLSIALFLMLFIGYFTGIIQPHGINPGPTEIERALPK